MKVVIKNEAGQFLGYAEGKIAFVDRKRRAYVYDYDEDKVEEQLRVVKAQHGCDWTWEDVGDANGLLCLPKTPYTGQEAHTKQG